MMPAEKNQPKGIQKPHSNDILSGKGKRAQDHEGNKFFRKIIGNYKEQYITAARKDKVKYCNLIYDVVKELSPPGNFLKQEQTSKLWFEIDKKKALEKIAHALREGAPEIMNKSLAFQSRGKRKSEETSSSQNVITNPIPFKEKKRLRSKEQLHEESKPNAILSMSDEIKNTEWTPRLSLEELFSDAQKTIEITRNFLECVGEYSMHEREKEKVSPISLSMNENVGDISDIVLDENFWNKSNFHFPVKNKQKGQHVDKEKSILEVIEPTETSKGLNEFVCAFDTSISEQNINVDKTSC